MSDDVDTIPNTEISFLQLKEMYGTTSTDGSMSLAQLYRGGTQEIKPGAPTAYAMDLVPDSVSTESIPTTGQISVENFKGTSKEYNINGIPSEGVSTTNWYADYIAEYNPAQRNVRKAKHISRIQLNNSVNGNPGGSLGAQGSNGLIIGGFPSDITLKLDLGDSGRLSGGGGAGGAGGVVTPSYGGGGTGGAGGDGAYYPNRHGSDASDNATAGRAGQNGGAGGSGIDITSYNGGKLFVSMTGNSKIIGGGGGGGGGGSGGGGGGAGGGASGEQGAESYNYLTYYWRTAIYRTTHPGPKAVYKRRRPFGGVFSEGYIQYGSFAPAFQNHANNSQFNTPAYYNNPGRVYNLPFGYSYKGVAPARTSGPPWGTRTYYSYISKRMNNPWVSSGPRLGGNGGAGRNGLPGGNGGNGGYGVAYGFPTTLKTDSQERNERPGTDYAPGAAGQTAVTSGYQCKATGPAGYGGRGGIGGYGGAGGPAGDGGYYEEGGQDGSSGETGGPGEDGAGGGAGGGQCGYPSTYYTNRRTVGQGKNGADGGGSGLGGVGGFGILKTPTQPDPTITGQTPNNPVSIGTA